MVKEVQLSIGLPVYNGEMYLHQAIDSLLNQEFKDFELIISDNASTDKTRAICQEYVALDKRVRYYRNDENMGATWNLNRVFDLSTAKYFMWASHDDFWYLNYIEECLRALKSSDHIVLAGSACEEVPTDWVFGGCFKRILLDPGVTTVGLKPAERFKLYKRALHNGRNINALFYGIYVRDILAKVMPLKNMIANDHILLSELSLLGEFITVDDILMAKRTGGASVSFKSIAGTLKIKNGFCIKYPYMIREISLQKMTWAADQMSFLSKVRLSAWSAANYGVLFLRQNYRRIRDLVS